jgi:hypothetical protein
LSGGELGSRKTTVSACERCNTDMFLLVLPNGPESFDKADECMLCSSATKTEFLPLIRSIQEADYFDPKTGKLYRDTG